MKALKKKKKKMYQHGGKVDPPKKGFKSRKTKGQPGDRMTNKDVTSNVMGLPGVRVYSETVRSRHHVFPPGHPRAGHARVHGPGETFAPASTIHTKDGLRRKGHGQVTRPLDPKNSPYIKNLSKGSKGVRSKNKK